MFLEIIDRSWDDISRDLSYGFISSLTRGNCKFLLLGLALLLLGWVSQSAAQTLPSGFSEQVALTGLTEPTVVQFASDGRIFVAEKSGLIKVFNNLGDTSPTIFADLRTNVYNYGKSGLLGMALDPNFSTMPYVYVLYTYDGPIGGTPPTWGDSCPPANADNCVVSARLSRLQANGNVMTGSEQVLVADWYQRYPGQPIGALAFGPDGALYASAGDGAGSTFVDFGQGVNPSPDPSNEGGALRSQDLRTPADPVALSGSIISIHPDTGQPLPQATSMLVGTPTVDANGVKSYAVTSVFQGTQPTIVRVLEPTNPVPGNPPRFLYVLPVQAGVTDLNSTHSDGLEELRLLNIHNRYNLTLIAPSFHIEPWYGDHDSNPDRRLESFIIKDLVPFGDSFASAGVIPQRWALGFSKSGTPGALSLILRHPNVFSAAAAWDAPAQFADMSAFPGMAENFGTEQNFDRYEIPPLVIENAEAFSSRNRIWISGDDSAWTSHMIQLHDQMVQAGVLHTWTQNGPRVHSWYSGWLEGAVASLSANATAEAPVDINAQRIIAYGLRSPSRFAFRPGTNEIWVGDAGLSDWEEINRVTNAADGVIENFGSPCYEGTATTAYAGLSICNDLYSEPAAVTPPVFAYNHNQQVVVGESCGVGSGSISGIAFYGTGSYPASYQGALFFSDASRNCIWVMPKGAGNLPDPASRSTFMAGAASPVDLKIGPGGDLFFVDLNGGAIRRIVHSGTPVDTTPPVRSNGAPSGTLAVGTTQSTLSLATNENATCRYATTAGVAYGSMLNTFTTTGGTSHSTTVSGLSNGASYSFFVRCQDTAGNANPDDFTISFSVAQPADTTPPVLSNGAPSGTLAAGTTQTTLSLATDESASCRYGTTAGVAYASMPNPFTTTGTTAHSTTVTGLTNGGSYNYFVRCQDTVGNANTNDFTISFSVAQPSAAGLVAAYSFNEGSGTSVSDASGNGRTGTISGAAWSTQGKFGNALSFDGVNDWVTVADAPALDLTTGMTLQAWVFPTITNGVRDIMIKEGSNVDIYNLYARNGGGRPESNVFVGGTNRTAEGTALPANVWTHVAGTYDGATLRLFINGVQAASTAISGSIATSTGPLRIGGNSMWGEFFQGRIDEIRIYNRALTQAEIQADMNTSVGGVPSDTTPPVRSNGTPNGTLAFGTTQTTLSLATNENATCRYGTTSGVAYGSMSNTFTTTGGTSHSTTVSGLVNGGNYSFFVRCQDTAGNANPDDFTLSFSVAQTGQDTVPPVVAITSPSDAATIAGVVNITADASDNVGVAGVQFLLDGANLGGEITSAPYALLWDTTTVPVGPYTLTARARDAAGNNTTSTAVSVAVVNNPVPAGFHDEVVIGSGLTFPTAFEFLPDGRMLIAEFRGRLLVVQPGANSVDATPVLDLPNIFDEDVTVGGERGLVNVVADPDFANNSFIYVFYTAATPQRDRVSRFTMTGNTADPASELVVWQGVANSTSTDHHGGGLAFGPDGKLYISTGDNGDPPSSQPLTSDHGKILRVNKDGTIPSDNPFFDGNGPNIDAIWARGLRNPYRFSFDPANGRMYIGDVGSNSGSSTEEVNIGVAGANYGWPTCEGPCGTAGMTNPLFTYSHSGRDAAITGGFVYRGSQFPASYQGVYFYGDFAQNWIRYLTLNASGNVTGSHDFLPADGSLDGPFDPVMLKSGPDGSLYYVDFGWGWQESVNPAAIRRIRFVSGNQPPVVVASAAPRNGQAPLSVSFSSAGSFDPENQALSYTWTFGDGNTSNAANPVHAYAQSGLYNAQLALSDGTSTTLSDVLTIAVGTLPQGSITSPANGLVFRAGDVISFSGTATDSEDGSLPASAYSWTILFHHDSHVHPTLGPVSGSTSGTFTIPSTGHDFSGSTSYEIILTVTDSSGLQHTSSVFVLPHKINLTFVTNPAGLTINVDGISRSTPYVKDTLTGFQHTIDAPNQTQGSINYAFVSWSDGGAQSHGITVGEVAATYTATYQSTTVTAFPNSATVLTGTLSSGTAAALVSDNNVYYAVNSTTTGTRIAAWYGSFTGVSKSLSNLRVNYKGNNSGNCTQTVAIWRWTTSAWVQLDSRTVGTTEVAINNLVPTGTLADYVSGAGSSGELRVRIQCQATANRTNRGDLMSIVYDAPVGPPPPDTTPPVLSNGAPSGTLAAGTTQTTLSLATDENASCRYATTAGVAYGSMTNTFTTTGTTAHFTTVTGLTNGGSYNYFVRCQDTAGNANTNDFTISFSVAQPSAAGLVAAYSFNEGSGTSVSDASGNGRTGTISGAAWSTQGKFGNALSFDGVNDWVTVADAPALDLTTGMTLQAWVFPTITNGVRDIMIKEGSNVDIYNLYARNGGDRPESNVFVGGTNRTAEGTALSANVWTHIAGTYDGATLRLFINGVQAASTAISGSIATSTGPLRIGGNSMWGEFFQGRIDEIRIYNRALTQVEIQGDMNTPIGP